MKYPTEVLAEFKRAAAKVEASINAELSGPKPYCVVSSLCEVDPGQHSLTPGRYREVTVRLHVDQFDGRDVDAVESMALGYIERRLLRTRTDD
jgi:hypothetical protein